MHGGEMKLKTLKCAAAAGMLALAGTAGAATITFDSLTTPELWATVPDTYVEQGFSFAATLRGAGDALYSYGTSNPLSADPTGATLGENYNGYGILVSALSGGSFTLASFDLANDLNDASGGTVRFSYTDATGTHNTELVLADQRGLQTFNFDLTGLRSFTLWDDDFQVDNVKVEAQPLAVPEPASYGMLLAGIAALVAVRRRKA